MVKRSSWLSLTPEPERELPRLLATLAHGGAPPRAEVVAEEQRVRGLILRGSESAWLAYLHQAVELIESGASPDDPDDVAAARARAVKVLANHHNLLLGLPGRAAQRTAGDRTRLAHLSENLT